MLLTRDQMYNKMNSPAFLGLIVEVCQNRPTLDTAKAVFTLRDEKDGYISLKKLFVTHVAEDPSEASFAQALFGDVGYWLRVSNNRELKEVLPAWREEAEILRKSVAFTSMTREVKEGGRNAFSAAKYLIEEPWKGRAKKVVEQKKKTTEKAAQTISSDIEFMKEYLQ